MKLFGFTTRGVLTDSYIEKIVTCLKQKYEAYWKNSLGNNTTDEGRLYIYRQIKTSFMFEPYLKQVDKINVRRALTKMRISANNLEIDRSRQEDMQIKHIMKNS